MNPSIHLGETQFLDANVIIRYLMGDHPEFTTRATQLIESDRDLTISIVVLGEVGYVLTKVYQVDRIRASDAMIELLNRANIESYEVDTDIAIDALRLCRPSGRVSFVDAFLWALVRGAGNAKIWTFDARFPSEGVVLSKP